jgi:hypothetical protein
MSIIWNLGANKAASPSGLMVGINAICAEADEFGKLLQYSLIGGLAC